MIRGTLFQKSEKEWDSFLENIIQEKIRKNKKKKVKFFLTTLVLIVATFFVVFLKPSKPQYLYAKIPLKNSPSFIAKNGISVEMAENTFFLNAGVSK